VQSKNLVVIINLNLKIDNMENLIELDKRELQEIEGGVAWYVAMAIGMAGAVITHVAIEAYNDWEAHVDAFKEGMEAAK
jgi:lactobin A/cerein 7B family class IIb bacteriocin